MKAYAGIGSRRAPQDIRALATRVAESLRQRDWVLRSGHAPGMDQAFEAGAEGAAEIFLPWASFETGVKINDRALTSAKPSRAAFELSEEFHPNWYSLRQGSRALHARNAHQILGADLLTPARFVLCWTPDGSLDGLGVDTGGTGQALRIAAAFDVEVFNLALPEHRERVTHNVC